MKCGIDHLFSFYRIGFTVATHPWNTIICSILLTICCAAGLLAFYKEKNPLNLWIPKGIILTIFTYLLI